MKKSIVLTISKFYIGFCFFSLLYLSVISMISPQNTMDLVNVSLDNNDAISSIRGVFGGVGITISASILLLFLKKRYFDVLLFLSMFWGLYTVSRLITILVDGKLGDFGNQWIMIESILSICGLALLILSSNKEKKEAI
ncbi:MAG: DUF4345 domain-containing protein [Brumimicrobium sp.]